MWIFSKYGFFSIAEERVDKTATKSIIIRVRRADDYSNMIELLNELQIKKKTITKSSAYKYHIYIDKKDWESVVGPVLIKTIDYRNFKREVFVEDDNRDYVYQQIYEIMEDYQNGKYDDQKFREIRL